MATAKKATTSKAAAKTSTSPRANSVPKSSLTSPVTTDLPNTPVAGDGMVPVDLTKAEVKVPAASISTPAAEPDANWTEADEESMKARDKSYEQRVIDHGIGLVQVEGIDFRYVGVAPARDKNAETDDGYPVTPRNTRFTPLTEVPFHPSIRVKDPKTGKFYMPPDGATGWADVVSPDGNDLVPKDVHKEQAKARREAAKEARTR